MVGALSTSPSSSANSSYSSFFPLHTTYCIGLKEISFFGNTANRNAPCNTAENSRQLLLRAFALNDTDAAFMLYEFYRDGIGGEKSPAEAQKYLEYAARRLCYPAVQELKKQQK